MLGIFMRNDSRYDVDINEALDSYCICIVSVYLLVKHKNNYILYANGVLFIRAIKGWNIFRMNQNKMLYKLTVICLLLYVQL